MAEHKNLLPREKIDERGDILAREGISQAPKGTSILQTGRDASIPSFAAIRANLMKSIIPDFQKSIKLREDEKHTRPFRLTDVPAERFAMSLRPSHGDESGAEKGVKSGYEAVDEHGTQHRKRAVMYEDTNYIGIANLQIYAFFGLTAAAGLGSVLILASLKRMPQLLFALPFALFSGWQMYGFYLSTRAAAEQATKIQYLRMVQGGIDQDDPDRQSKFVKKPPSAKEEMQQVSDDDEKKNNAVRRVEDNDTIVVEKAAVVGDMESKSETKKKESHVDDKEKKPVRFVIVDKQRDQEEDQFAKLQQSISVPASR